MKRAFTLIELLVVIAIIAILAAILFPVFAQAKTAAKKTAALNNMKNIGTASKLYSADNDDTFPSVYDGPNCGGDPICTMYPYIKNLQIWHGYRQNGAPQNTRLNADGTVSRGWNDIGYNWGWEIRGAEGMINEERCNNGGPVQGCTAGRFNTGKSETQLANPSQMFAFGNTYDTPRQTIGGVGWFFDRFPGSRRNNGIYFGAQVAVVMADSSAKMIPWKGGTLGTTLVGTPKNFTTRVNGYCADPEGRVNPFPRDGFPLGTGWLCRDWLAYPEAAGVVWWTD
ncbi:MAG: prepilin-type N-terminal cleavage/methylation domain-containing protein [Fimbriimonadaceae bacterium]|nr:prepilin-type N-terminal cleavage/methylation domain-containing protein [Fimbriimonadaceae bacterium]